MITVTRKLLSEDEVRQELAALARRYSLPSDCCDETAADQMSDFDAMKWASLCGFLKAATRYSDSSSENCVPLRLRSIYGMKAPFRSKALKNVSDKLTDLAA